MSQKRQSEPHPQDPDTTELFPGVSSEHLVQRFVEGEAEATPGSGAALRGLFQRHWKAIARLIHRRLKWEGDWLASRAPEVNSIVWHSIRRTLKKFKAESRFMTWAYVIVRREVKKFVTKLTEDAKEVQAPIVDEETGATSLDLAPGREPSVVRQAELREVAADLDAAVEQLPPDERAVFVLRKREFLDWDEIARVLAAPKTTVQERMRRAFMRLRNLLRHHAPDPRETRGESHDALHV